MKTALEQIAAFEEEYRFKKQKAELIYDFKPLERKNEFGIELFICRIQEIYTTIYKGLKYIRADTIFALEITQREMLVLLGRFKKKETNL